MSYNNKRLQHNHITIKDYNIHVIYTLIWFHIPLSIYRCLAEKMIYIPLIYLSAKSRTLDLFYFHALPPETVLTNLSLSDPSSRVPRALKCNPYPHLECFADVIRLPPHLQGKSYTRTVYVLSVIALTSHTTHIVKRVI